MTADAVLLPNVDAVDVLRASLARDAVLWEPTVDVQGRCEWAPVTGREPFVWNAPRPLPTAKRFFFPARETLLRWGRDEVTETLPVVRPFVLFGVAACDVAAIACQDRFFTRDPYYRRRRDQALLVAVNCLAACAGGFCRDVGAGPFTERPFDIALTQLSDGRVVLEAGSARGAAAVDAARLCTRAVEDETRAAVAAARSTAAASFAERPFIAAALERLDGRNAGEPVGGPEWQALGPACFACTGCTSLCPTCSCFTIVDEVDGSERGERVRFWDSCLLEGFQRESSGHHPAPTAADRVRRFWYHKLSPDFVPALGRIGCVGCGRCDTTCLGVIGALSVMRRLGISR
jgi:sulfhydrogenase subunit beta (sulfur reductase)